MVTLTEVKTTKPQLRLESVDYKSNQGFTVLIEGLKRIQRIGQPLICIKTLPTKRLDLGVEFGGFGLSFVEWQASFHARSLVSSGGEPGIF